MPSFLKKVLRTLESVDGMYNYYWNAVILKDEKFAIEEETRLIGIFDKNYEMSSETRKLKAYPQHIYIGYKEIDDIKEYLISYCERNNIEYDIIKENDCY